MSKLEKDIQKLLKKDKDSLARSLNNYQIVALESGEQFIIDPDSKVLTYNGKGFTFEFLQAFVEDNPEKTYLIENGAVVHVYEVNERINKFLDNLVEQCSNDKAFLEHLRPQITKLFKLCSDLDKK